jgi:hypothetical protein
MIYFNTEHNLFCNITHIANDYIIINANGYEYKSHIDFMLVIG